MSGANDIIVGIDLGTTNSLIAYADERGPHLIPNANDPDDFLLPSVVGFHDRGAVESIGREARAHAEERPTTTIHSIKRLMGKGLAEIEDESSQFPFRIAQAEGESNRDLAAVVIGTRQYTPPEISAIILRELKNWAEAYFKKPVRRAVITVPAQFDDAQRQATRDAGAIAGLDVLRIVNEPTAAALAYGLDRSERATVAVYDLGGGTFDVSILRLEDGIFEVVATNGDTHLGGDDFDHELNKLFGAEIKAKFGIEITSPAIKQQLRTLAEITKIRLAESDRASVEISLGTDRVYSRTITRAEFEGLIKPYIQRTIDACSRALRTARLAASDIDQVVLVGGSTRIPYVRRNVAETFGRDPYIALTPEHVVALGAGVQAAILAGKKTDMLLLDVTPLSLGIETMGGGMGKLIAANTKVPCRASELFTTFQDGQTTVKINVLQGERELAQDCRSLGIFELRDVPPMPAGIPKIEVVFLIDQNGILNVSAREMRSGKESRVQILPAHGLTREEVRRMTSEGIAHAREDMAAHHLIDVRTTVQFDLNKADRMLQKYGDLLDSLEKQKLTAAAAELREFAENCNDAAVLNERRNAFNHDILPLAELAMTQALRET